MMINPPKTKAEARECSYGGGHMHKPRPWNPERCAAECDKARDCRFPQYGQCSKKPGHGPDGLYCKQHAKWLFDPPPRKKSWPELLSESCRRLSEENRKLNRKLKQERRIVEAQACRIRDLISENVKLERKNVKLQRR